jgi:Tol biopolymer transport system component
MVFLVACLSGVAHAQSDEWPLLSGPYLGQRTPGTTPQVFAPGIISTEAQEGSCVFTSDGRQFWFVRRGSSSDGIFATEMVDGAWTPPRLASFSAGKLDWDFVLAPDDRSMFIASARSVADGGPPQKNYRIWLSEKSDDAWSLPLLLPPLVNSGAHDSFPSVSTDGTLYFFSRRAGGQGEGDIYRAELSGGVYARVERLGQQINTPHDEVDPFIAPDESYLIFCSNKPGGAGSYDIYISFRAADGSWSPSIAMGSGINTERTEYIPYVTRDGRFLFFTSDLPGHRDIYWMDASVIETLRAAAAIGAGAFAERQAVAPIDYLGQRPPGMVPEIFAPGVVSTDKNELNSVFAPDGKEFYFSIAENSTYTIYVMRRTGTRWSEPEVASFSTEHSNVDMSFSPDGRRLLFGSKRPLSIQGPPSEGFNIWAVTRTETGWSEPEDLGPLVNAGAHQVYPTVTKDLTLYFQSRREGALGGTDIYRARHVDGAYTEPENLGPAINTEHDEGDVFVAPDESFLIVSTRGRSDSLGGSDLYVSFRQADGSWTPVKNMGPAINSRGTDYCPMLSPDGRYLFYTSTRDGHGDIYWVDARVIQKLRKD